MAEREGFELSLKRPMQKIYKLIDEEFETFVNNNKELFSSMRIGEVIKINDSKIIKGKRLRSTSLLKSPFNIAYLGKLKGGEGAMLLFFNKDTDRVYTYYDVNL